MNERMSKARATFPTRIVPTLVSAFLCTALAAQTPTTIPSELPATASRTLAASLEASKRHRQHVWRDTPPFAPDGTVNAYVEIPRGERRKFEFDMGANTRAIDRVMPADVGGYPVNYGFVPQTVSYDGDPYDVLVLGPAQPGGRIVRGAIVGLMLMEDEKGLDSKTVVSPVDERGRPTHTLTKGEQERIAEYFRKYKLHETGKFSKVPGWGSAADGRAYIQMTHAFFRQCRERAGSACRVERP